MPGNDENGSASATIPLPHGSGTVPGATTPADGAATALGSLPQSAPTAALAAHGKFTPQPQNNEAEIFNSPQEANLFRVSIKVPPFWIDRPALWFAQIEAQFALAGITADMTKFYHVISHLDHQIAVEVEDIITSPPSENKYSTIKSELIRRLSVSQEQKEKQLLMHEELGSRKPSQFLRHLLHLAGPNKLPESFIRTVWTSRLPINLQTIVASHPDMPLSKLSELADHIQDISSPSFRIAEVSPTAMPTPGTSSVS